MSGKLSVARALLLTAFLIGTQSFAFADAEPSDELEPVAQRGDHFGHAQATEDFDGDGFSDLAIGIRGKDVDGVKDAGAVEVMYGSPTGFMGVDDQLFDQNTPGIADEPDPADSINDNGPDGFGSTLAAGDLNGDGFSDLAIGVTGEDLAAGDAGAVHVLYGSSAGLNPENSDFWHQDSPGIGGEGEHFEHFGSSLTVGNFGRGRAADLVVGTPFEGFFDLTVEKTSVGVVNVIYGSSTGLTSDGSQLLRQGHAGLKGVGEINDKFGAALSANDFGKSRHADLAIGVTLDTVGSVRSGSVHVLYGTRSGLSSTDDEIWHQDSPSIRNVANETDVFGAGLASADFGNGARADLAISVLLEDAGDVSDAGAVAVVYGSPSGLTAVGDQLWHQDTPGIVDVAESRDYFTAFGSCMGVAGADFGKSSEADLAVGVCGEDLGAAVDAGAVNVIYGSSQGLTSAGNQLWHQDSPGIEDSAEGSGGFLSSDGFGFSVVGANLGKSSRADLAVGVRGEDLQTVVGAGAVNVIYGSSQGLTSAGNQFLHEDLP